MSELRQLAGYLAGAADQELPADVVERAKHHLLDAIAAIVSGSRLPAGERGRAWAEGYGAGGSDVATVVGWERRASAVAAALCNGMSAHADETDDSHPETLSHPGCAVVPAALAAAEAAGASGELLLRSVVAGYDFGCRVGRAVPLKERDASRGGPSSHAMVGVFGAAAAAMVAFRFDERQVRHAVSYTTQLCSGSLTWMRDTHHVEKAFVFAGMPASQGLLAATLVRSGCDGVEDVFSGSPNWLDGVVQEPRRNWLTWGLGSEYEVTRTTLKKYSVGSPAQAAVEAVLELARAHSLRADQVEGIEVRLPSDQSFIVDGREMPSINCQYLVAASLEDGRFTFQMAHDEERLRSPRMRDLMARVRLIPEERISGTRAAEVRLLVAGGRRLERTVTNVRGTVADPMTGPEVVAKARDLMDPVLGPERSAELCQRVLEVESAGRAAELLALMNAAAQPA